MTNFSSKEQNNDVDLIEIFHMLWGKKVWLMLFTFMCTLIAGIYTFTVEEQWTSRAVVIQPKTINYESYYKLYQEYARILNLPEERKNKIANVEAEKLFNDFDLSLKSLEIRKAYFTQSDYYKKLTEGKSEQEQRRILTNLITKNLTVLNADTKTNPDALGKTISLSARTAEEAQTELEKFITFANSSALDIEINNFIINLNEIISDLQYSKNKFERDMQVEKNVQLENLENALNIAKQANIQEYTKPFSSVNANSAIQAIAMSEAKIPLSDSKLSDGTYLFMLGEKYLKAQIDILKQRNVIYPPRYYEVSTLLSQLEPLRTQINNIKGQTFSYLATPNYPIEKDKPNRIIILGIGFILGLIIGASIILIRSLLTRREN